MLVEAKPVTNDLWLLGGSSPNSSKSSAAQESAAEGRRVQGAMCDSAWFNESKDLAGSRVYWSSISNSFLLERVCFTESKSFFVVGSQSQKY